MIADLEKKDGEVLHRNQKFAPVVQLDTSTMIAQAPLHGVIGLVNDADKVLQAKMEELDKIAKTKKQEAPLRKSSGVDTFAAEMVARYERMQTIDRGLEDLQASRTETLTKHLRATLEGQPAKRVKFKLQTTNPVETAVEKKSRKDKARSTMRRVHLAACTQLC